MSKHLAARLLDELIKEDRRDDANRTNWASMTAAIQKLVKDWSDKRRADLVAQHSAQILAPGSERPS